MQIYQIFTGRISGANLRDHRGRVFIRMEDFDWKKLVDLGFSHVYLLGVYDTGGRIVVLEEEGKDISKVELRVPSVFAISDHTRPHPGLGTKKELVNLIEKIHMSGLKVIVDFVPNQTNLDHVWTRSSPEYYQNANKGKKTGFSGDVLMLNLDNQELRQELALIVQEIESWGVDGVRCDMAHLAPIDFWKDLIHKAKIKYPRLMFIAEAYSESEFDWRPIDALLDAGFEAVYHEFLYRKLKLVSHKKETLSGLTEHINYVCQHYKYASKLIQYLSNHDDGLCVPESLVDGLWWLLKSLPGHLLMFNGLMNGRNNRLAHHTLEILPEKVCELHNTPTRPVQVEKYLAEYRPILEKTWIDNNVLWAEMKSNKGNLKYYICFEEGGRIESLDNGRGTILGSIINLPDMKKGDWGVFPAD